MAARSGIVVVAAALLALVAVSQAQAPGPSATPAGPPNVTAILVKGGQYTTFMRLMKETQQDTQLNSQLNNSFNGNGYTVFAPTDNAFNNLKPGTLNSLTQQQQVSLVQAHILPQYYTMESFQTASNPVRTQASGEKEPITVNIVASNNQVNVTTGLVEVAVNNALSAVKPLAVYSLDKVLLPEALFGAKAPAPAPAASKGGKTKKGEAASGPAGSDDEATPTGAAGARAVSWGVAGMAALLGYLL
ncbi:fasciclin-like arabinogalactan protein 11 [Aegilops tauschii subsp. strangulata]|uniref:FAS1 domain-containing protein n=2 Tax=Triticinae TaxID=1648030 RepID=A0A453F7C4_AEGTS|nr:fasciclin-like arabinogalactan protein 11 [Aegilops tauschii subsp. strangulata]XP_044357312.1 fasciclin-like arabinogalactan protein 11 [Triticum aestivum]